MISKLVEQVKIYTRNESLLSEIRRDSSRCILQPISWGEQTARDAFSYLGSARHNKNFLSTIKHLDDNYGRSRETLIKHYNMIMAPQITGKNLCIQDQTLLGAFCTKEYAFERSLCNPSVVIDTDQSGLKKGFFSLIFSFRAVGEEFSSVEFRKAALHPDNSIHFGSPFMNGQTGEVRELSGSSASVLFMPEDRIEQRILTPVMPGIDDNGIEDLRLVRSDNEDGTPYFYGTYTAFNRPGISSGLLGTPDFLNFTMSRLSGALAAEKGLAIFPRKIDVEGNKRYAAIARPDGKSLYLALSDNMLDWNEATLLAKPSGIHELIKIGNCGSPIETRSGWLLFYHGIGLMKRYFISAMMLSPDATQVTARLKEPLVFPDSNFSKGDVPNAVYSCGSALLPDGRIVFPWAEADTSCQVGIIYLNNLLAKSNWLTR